VTVFWPLISNCDLDLEVRVMKAVRDTPSSNGACMCKVSSNYVERIKTYGPDKQKVTIFCPLILNCNLNLSLKVGVMKAVCDTLSSDDLCVYEVSSNYVKRIKTYGPDKQKSYCILTFALEL
jgi:hypothetical protein